MPVPIVGLHHVTVIASDPQLNLDFYTAMLVVKHTVNCDNPGTYHFYFGDDVGSPGTILTFFPWPRANQGKPGVGETSATAFSVGAASLEFWEQRLLHAGVPMQREEARLGDPVLVFDDPDGTRLELVGRSVDVATFLPCTRTVPEEHSIRGLLGVSLCQAGFEGTARPFEKMGFQRNGQEGSRYRLSLSSSAFKSFDVCLQPQLTQGQMSAGSVRHIAWREEITNPLDVTPELDGPTVIRSTFANPDACCSRSRPALRASPSTSRSRPSAKLLNLHPGSSRSEPLSRSCSRR